MELNIAPAMLNETPEPFGASDAKARQQNLTDTKRLAGFASEVKAPPQKTTGLGNGQNDIAHYMQYLESMIRGLPPDLQARYSGLLQRISSGKTQNTNIQGYLEQIEGNINKSLGQVRQ